MQEFATVTSHQDLYHLETLSRTSHLVRGRSLNTAKHGFQRWRQGFIPALQKWVLWTLGGSHHHIGNTLFTARHLPAEHTEHVLCSDG